MSLAKKLITTYSKSLFQNSSKDFPFSMKEEDYCNFNMITSFDINTTTPDIYLIGEELLLIKSLLLSSKFMKGYFRNPTYPEGQKLSVILTIFPGLTAPTKSFLKILTERSHLFLIPEIAKEYIAMVLKFQNSITVKLFVATELKEAYGSLLLNKLRSLTNCDEVLIKVFNDPKLLGGMVVEYNSTSIDASILKEFSMFFNDV
jgi:F-type H+-transporting ATPase subunit delta